MELLVFGHGGARVLVFPTRMGRFHEYEDGGMVAALRSRIENGWLQLFCVDSIDADSLYCDWKHPRERILRHLQYERYILEEVIPFMHWKNPTPFQIVHGCSLGAFHAVNIALRHPDLFDRVVAFSGRFDLTEEMTGFGNLFGGYYDQDIYFNTPSHFVPGLTESRWLERLRRLDIKLVVGETDPFRPNNQRFSTALWDKGLWHAFTLWGGRAHSFRRWCEMAPHFL